MVKPERSKLGLQVQVYVGILRLDVFQVVSNSDMVPLHKGGQEESDLLALGWTALKTLVVRFEVVEFRVSNDGIHHKFLLKVSPGQCLTQVGLTQLVVEDGQIDLTCRGLVLWEFNIVYESLGRSESQTQILSLQSTFEELLDQDRGRM